jgi:hypothetical protein
MMKKPKGYRGGDAAKSDRASGRNAGRADERGSVDRSAVSATSNYRRNVLADQRKKTIEAITPSSTFKNKAIALGLGLVIPGAGLAYKSAIDKTALGYGRSNKKTSVNKVDRDNSGGGGGVNQKTIQPIITPIQATKPVDTNLIKPKDNFFNFVAYKVGGLSGGVSYGPPPKKGPNSQVPPVKMKKGGLK